MLNKGLAFRTQILVAFFTISLGLSFFYYQKNLSLQNSILQENFVKNNQLIFKTVKLGLEVGLKSDNFEAINDVFNYAKKQKDLSWIIITDGRKDVFATYPESLNVQQAWSEVGLSEFDAEKSIKYTVEDHFHTPITQGRLIISFDTASYYQIKSKLRRDSIFLTLIVLVVSLLISLVIAKFLITRLEKLQKTIENITSGNFYEKIDVLTNTREIANVSSSFNLMMEQLNLERDKSENLLLNVLPPPIAQRLKNNEETIALSNDSVSIMFADLVGYTAFSHNKMPEEVVFILNKIFIEFDNIIDHLGLEKIKTIGDAYLVAGGLFCDEDQSLEMFELAKGLQQVLNEINKKFNSSFKVRIGLHCGGAVAGVLGKIKFSFDVWGNTVNLASRLESNGIAGRIHMSQQFITSLKARGLNIENLEANSFKAKGIGELNSYFL